MFSVVPDVYDYTQVVQWMAREIKKIFQKSEKSCDTG